MNRYHVVRLVLAALLFAIAPASIAQQPLEIIPLRHRTADQVLPVLQPLLEPGATLSGMRGQLFLRASPANADDIKRALAAIDRPAKRLQISVRLDDAAERERREVQASGSVGSGGVRFSGSAQDARSTAAERVDQRLQVLEGSRAYINTGQSRLMRLPDGTVVQELAAGFEVVPRVSGDRVHLDIAQQRETVAQSQRLGTSTTARFGEWVEIGGVAQAASADQGGIGSMRAGRSSEQRRVWVKVDALD